MIIKGWYKDTDTKTKVVWKNRHVRQWIHILKVSNGWIIDRVNFTSYGYAVPIELGNARTKVKAYNLAISWMKRHPRGF